MQKQKYDYAREQADTDYQPDEVDVDLEDIDAILDEIDELLEKEGDAFVKNYVQENGQ